MMMSAKKILIISIVVVLVAAVSVYGMQVLTSVSQVAPVSSVATWDQFEVKLEVNKAEFRVGESVEVKVSLTNTGNETAVLDFTHKNQKVMFRIFDINATEVFGTHLVGLMAGEKVSLEPNQTLSETYAWMQKGGGSDVYNATTQVPAGNYSIIGITGRFFYKDVFPSTWIETQPMVITLG